MFCCHSLIPATAVLALGFGEVWREQNSSPAFENMTLFKKVAPLVLKARKSNFWEFNTLHY